MPDLITANLPLLQDYRLPGLNIDQPVMYPYYNGRSILNVPSSLCSLLDAPPIGAPALERAILKPLGAGVQRVILVLVDALALHRLKRWMVDGTAPVWAELVHDGILAPLTSITPSTTSAALTTLWTGRSAAEHGITGYEMWLKEYGVIANMILHAPASFNALPGSLEKAGFEPKTYLPFPTLGSHLAAYGIQSHAFQHHAIARSGLSQMLFKDVIVHPFGASSDLWVSVRQFLEVRPDQRLYAWVYWGELDTLSHRFGPDDERAAAEFSAFSLAFQRHFLERLDTGARKDTLLILLSDHGMLATPPDPFYELRKHPALERRLHMLPTGENRLMYLYPRPGQIGAIREYIERTWFGRFTVLDSAYAVHNGLFGEFEKHQGAMHPRLLERVGDLIVYPGPEGYLWWAQKENFLLGRHGGLHPEEMLVPFLAARLG